jgi:hypothetical protein
MAKAGYSASTEGAIALVAATAKTVLTVLAPAQFGCDLKKLRVAFDGVTASDKAVLVEVLLISAAGTNTAGTVNQLYGRAITAGFTTGKNNTVEPTVTNVVDSFMVSPYNGTVVYDFPLGDTPDSAVSAGFAVRLTAPTSAVNARATLFFERC